ncbi:MAG: HlyD family type I secretion periplasmic adaptor subunit [Candidatus Competibacteraceae bacterium]|nr:HlyD family type I secretion periplasmic adaptor subunit [Candidatus Competibacteraceae bacterium]MCP5124352.1 HlyD family type I secretion periplasmic adaptor subunit [Gammaproteobacteria bacterium]HRX70022.1 HlyD family type I secretion periplasmic adaptor subunit [Candidatus Competibacteraceae bacterium]
MQITIHRSATAGLTPKIPDAPIDDRPVRRTGYLILILAFGVFGGWAALAGLNSAVVAPGVVTVDSYRKTVQHLEGGIVKEILVRDGDEVKTGDVLLRLDDTQVRAQLEMARNQYLTYLALYARLQAEREQHKEIVFPQELQDAGNDPRVKEIMMAQQREFEARHATLQGEIAVLEQRIDQLEEQTRGLSALQAIKQKRIDSYGEEVRDMKKLFERGLGDKLRLREMERLALELEGERAEHLSDISRVKLQINETRLQIIQRQKAFQEDVASQLRDTQAKYFDLQERLRALRDTLDRTDIRATTDGVVVGMGIHTIGGVISPGSRILDIVPRGERLVVEAQVSPVDIDKVHPNLVADIRFSAFSTRTTPVVDGVVETVSADRLTDQATHQAYYLARISVAATGKETLSKLGLTVLPGMPAEVMIKTGERTFLNYLLRPIQDRLAQAFRED